jgi:hypothetical protein
MKPADALFQRAKAFLGFSLARVEAFQAVPQTVALGS